MPMFAWGLDEIAEGVGVIYVFEVIGLLVLLVKLEQGLAEAPKPRTRARPPAQPPVGQRRHHSA